MKGRFAASWALALCLCLGGTCIQAKESGSTLASAAKVAATPEVKAKEHLPVHLNGVVTFTWHQGTSEFTIQDDSGAVWVPPVALPPNFAVGSRIELDGRTEAGAIGTIVLADAVRVLDPDVLPAATPASYDDLFSNTLHGVRVEVTGIVRGQRVNPESGLGWLALEVASGGRRFTANVTHEISGHPELVDARVRIRGVNLRALGRYQDGFLPVLNAHSLEDITIIDPPVGAPLASPVVPLDRVMRDPVAGGSGRRIHLRGVVSALRPNQSFFLQDATRGLEVFLRDSSSPALGDEVDVIGFPEPGAFSPSLHDADWRPGSGQTLLTPLPSTPADALRQDGRLLSLEGQVTGHALNPGELVLRMEERGVPFRVTIPGATPADFPVGCIVKAIGVCSVEATDWEALVVRHQPSGFTLLARQVSDVTVVRPAPFWTARSVAVSLGLVAFVLAAAQGMVWIRARRRIRELSRSRDEAEAQFVAVIAERTRMAREIHDTLAQGFTAISAQLEVIHDQSANFSTSLRKHLDLARQLVRSSLEESRRSVWNLRAQTLEENGLLGTLERLGEQLVVGKKTEFRFTAEGDVRTLAPSIENDVLRVAQEALTNAIRHGHPQRITCAVAFDPKEFRLVIKDDGAGFTPGSRTQSHQGGFGLSGMAERAKEIHAKLEVESRPGLGTQIKLTIPNV
ncbi:MAG: sensor histidine kinase [Verrucomicrobiota bacterium]